MQWLELADIVAGGEHVALAADQHDANAGIGFCAFDRIGQRAVHRVGQRVLLVGPRHRQAENAAVVLDLDMVRH